MSANAGSLNPEAVRKMEGEGADRTLEALLERVTGLDGPDRETDVRVQAYFDGRVIEWDTYRPTGARCLISVNPRPPHEHFVAWIPGDPGYEQKPSLTASLDAVVALCERLLPGWFWDLRQHSDGICEAMLRLKDGRAHGSGYRPTPALALLAALLEALVKSRSPSLVGG
jgi:hypothetical protein